MKVQQFIKKLNNTELGKGNTHEYYVLVPSGIMDGFFDSSKPSVFDCIGGSELSGIHISNGREFRINGLGDYYRNNDVNAGDEIIFQKTDDNGIISFDVNLKTNKNLVTLQKIGDRGFEILSLGNLSSSEAGLSDSYEIKAAYQGILSTIKIEFNLKEKKRKDSPEETSFYKILVNDQDVQQDFNGKGFLVNIRETGNGKVLCKSCTWQKYEFNY
ncbi:hypothetical protein N9400_01230 [Candidatus Thioglobus sp.]|nr:hypothetical protein [Candidatus Thioglobus sp.]